MVRLMVLLFCIGSPCDRKEISKFEDKKILSFSPDLYRRFWGISLSTDEVKGAASGVFVGHYRGPVEAHRAPFA